MISDCLVEQPPDGGNVTSAGFLDLVDRYALLRKSGTFGAFGFGGERRDVVPAEEALKRSHYPDTSTDRKEADRRAAHREGTYVLK